MADKTVLDSRPSQISSKDMQESDNPIPLSPQWLLPKLEENKTGIIMGGNNLSPYPGDSSHSDNFKSPVNVEKIHDTKKKTGVFRPSVLDMESGRRDRWRDEERETNSFALRDRWREGDRELGDNRKSDRWIESSGKHFGEARRASSERWSDSSNREGSHEQRRESKWNTRWGPDDKMTDGSREKWTDTIKDADMPVDKGLSHITHHGKEDEGENYRPWRSGLPHSRGNAEPPHHQTPTANKHIPTFAHGRGRGENSPSIFSLGRGKSSFGGGFVNNVTSHSQLSGSLLLKDESGHGGHSSLRYSRTKLLDVYRLMDIRSCKKLLNGFVQLPSITLEEALEPLSFFVSTPEELDIFKGIDKGDIVSSGAPQVAKDGSVDRNSTDLIQSRRPMIGSREDLPVSADYSKDENVVFSKSGHATFSEGISNEKQLPIHGPTAKNETLQGCKTISDHILIDEAGREDGVSNERNGVVPAIRESSMQGNSSGHPGAVWRSASMSEHNLSVSHGWREMPADLRPRASNIGWQLKKDFNKLENSMADSSLSKDGHKWQTVDDPVIKRQHSLSMDRQQGMPKLMPQSPEDMLLYYKDPQGEVQGPFSGSDIIGWFEAGYFGIDLQVRHANAPHGSPFLLLGDVMPHLRAKAGPPPGFGAPKHNETSDGPSRSTFGSFGKLHKGSSEIDIACNEIRYDHSLTTDAENRFLKSLMSGNISGSPLDTPSPSKGMQGYLGNNSGLMPPESGDDPYLQAKRIALERQRSLPSPHLYWPERDTATIAPMADNFGDSSIPHPKSVSSIADNPLQQPLPQNVDLLSVLQGLTNKSSSGIKNGAGVWSNFPAQGGLHPLQDKFDTHQAHNLSPQVAFGIQQSMKQTQKQPNLGNLMAQVIDNPSNTLTLDKQLSSSHSNDAHFLNLLQQQHLLHLHTQGPIPSQQLSLFDKILLLNQQKEQDDQLLQQQQQLLSQVLSGQHTQQRQFPGAGFSARNPSTFQAQFQQSHELLQNGSQQQIPIIQDESVTNFANLPPVVSRDASHCIGSAASDIHLPHQLFSDAIRQEGWSSTPKVPIDIQPKSSFLESPVIDSFPQAEVVHKYSMEPPSQKISSSDEPMEFSTDEATVNFTPTEHQVSDSMPLRMTKNDTSLPEEVDAMSVAPDAVIDEPRVEKEECNVDPFIIKDVKNVEACQVKKVSEKKSRKQKSSKALSSDQSKGPSKSQQSKQCDVDGTNVTERRPDVHMVPGEVLHKASSPERKSKLDYSIKKETMDLQQGEAVVTKYETGKDESVAEQTTQVSSAQRAWKPASGFKPKSLLEIQQEEQRKAREDDIVSEISTAFSSTSFSSPLSCPVANLDNRQLKEILQDAAKVDVGTSNRGSLNHRSNKSQLHDLLVEETSANLSKRETEVTNGLSSSASLPVTSSQPNSVDFDNFIDAKDTKKSRKKSSKAKSAGAKVSASVASANVSIGSSPVEKAKSSQQVQQDKEVLPAVPSGPSLGDFVVWREEPADPPAPAWSTDSGKVSKPTSLRDILKEQERKVSSGQNKNPLPLSQQKSLSAQTARGSGSWSLSSVTTAKTSSPIQINSQASRSKHKVDDDLFWGPLDQPRQEEKRSDFPHLANQSSCVNKTTPGKGTSGGSLSKQKSVGGRSASFSSSPASAKGKNAALSKHYEAMGFRDWCESECARLIGTKDTNFLEFCLKQSRSEAEMLLIENLGSFDPDHKFIDKFLNYKDLLPSDVLEITFQSLNDQKVPEFGDGDVTSNNAGGVGGPDKGYQTVADGSAKGGKKKGKKGKKVSPSVLGFNVVSNRIMMGEIQTIED